MVERMKQPHPKQPVFLGKHKGDSIYGYPACPSDAVDRVLGTVVGPVFVRVYADTGNRYPTQPTVTAPGDMLTLGNPPADTLDGPRDYRIFMGEYGGKQAFINTSPADPLVDWEPVEAPTPSQKLEDDREQTVEEFDGLKPLVDQMNHLRSAMHTNNDLLVQAIDRQTNVDKTALAALVEAVAEQKTWARNLNNIATTLGVLAVIALIVSLMFIGTLVTA